MGNHRTWNQPSIIRWRAIGHRRYLHTHRSLRDATLSFVIIGERADRKSILLSRRLSLCWSIRSRALSDLGFLNFAKHNGSGARFAIPEVVDINLASRSRASNGVSQRDFIDDGRAANLGDDIPSLNTTLVGGATHDNFFDVSPSRCPYGATLISGDVLWDQSKRTSCDLALGDQLVGDIFRGVGRNCIADTNARTCW